MAIRVLLVDDVVHVRRLVRSALRLRGGFEVVGEADNGADAVRLTLRSWRPTSWCWTSACPTWPATRC